MIKHFRHLRTLEKCRKNSPPVRVFYISLRCSQINACRVLSQCNTQPKLLYSLSLSRYIHKKALLVSNQAAMFLADRFGSFYHIRADRSGLNLMEIEDGSEQSGQEVPSHLH